MTVPTFQGQPLVGQSAASTQAQGALAFIRQVFDTYFGGALSGLIEQAYRQYLEGVPLEQIVEDIRRSPEHRSFFPGWAELRERGRGISEGQYIALTRSYIQQAGRFDLPEGFLDRVYLGRLIANETSPDEFGERLQVWADWERATRDPVAEQEINRQFAAAGLVPSDGDYLAAVLDAERAAITTRRRLEAGLVGAEAVRSGFGQLATEQAFDLAAAGVTAGTARQGFGALAESRELFTPLPGEGASTESIEQAQQLGAVFTGDAEARRRIEAQRRRRQAAFEGGGEFAPGRTGLAGAGAAGAT